MLDNKLATRTSNRFISELPCCTFRETKVLMRDIRCCLPDLNSCGAWAEQDFQVFFFGVTTFQGSILKAVHDSFPDKTFIIPFSFRRVLKTYLEKKIIENTAYTFVLVGLLPSSHLSLLWTGRLMASQRLVSVCPSPLVPPSRNNLRIFIELHMNVKALVTTTLHRQWLCV